MTKACREILWWVVLAVTLPVTDFAPAFGQTWGKKSTVDTEWVVFSSGRSGSGDVYAVQPKSGKTVRVVGTTLPESSIRYDAFRDRLVFTRFENDGAVVVSDGRDLFEDPNGDVSPVWSPDGWRIAYSAVRDGQEDLFLARTDGSREKRLTNDPEPDRYPAWSPDGTRIVFARRDEVGWDLFTLDLRNAKSIPERLTSRNAYVGHPAWSPDGQYVAFDTMVGEQVEIAVLEIETGAFTVLTESSENDLVPAWSLDGKRIAYAGADSTGNWDVWTIDVASQEESRLTTHAGFDGGPVYVPPSALGQD